jgi:hypothetical protein
MLRTLGETESAQQLDEDTLARRRRTLGQDHPDTLTSAHNLAATLEMLGRHKEALALHQDTYERRRRVLGDDHPHTLASARHLDAPQHPGGDKAGTAQVVDEDSPALHRPRLGELHPGTLKSATRSAIDEDDEDCQHEEHYEFQPDDMPHHG